MIFYKHFIGDYQRDTGHLTLTEHGAYRLMLDNFYGTSRPLPADRKALYRLLRAENSTERKAIDKMAVQFWRPLPPDLETVYELLRLCTEEDKKRYNTLAQTWEEYGGLINLRALREMIGAVERAEINKKIAIDREAKKRQRTAEEGAK